MTLKIKLKVTSFRPRTSRIDTWFKFKGNIQNASKVISLTRNHTDDADDHDDDDNDGTKSNMSPPQRELKIKVTKIIQQTVKCRSDTGTINFFGLQIPGRPFW